MKNTIFTLNGYANYGNRLQLFALSNILRENGIATNVYWPKTPIDKIKDFVKYQTPIQIRSVKEKKLQIFTKKYIPKRTTNKVDTVAIVGSDQVWNPSYLEDFPYLLNTGCSKSIAYAASIGLSTLSHEQEETFKNALENYSAISVREQSAKELLQPLTDKKIEVVLDPTLLLDKSEYEALEKKPKALEEDEKYVLCYILGNRDHEAAIEKFAKEKGYKTIYFSDKRDSSYGIEEFLYLIHHAQLICTDSFHACVFSFIFECPFVAFRRTGKENYMYTRLQNLIDTFELEEREFNGEKITKQNQVCGYSEAKKILKKEQEKSLNFLKRALDIKDEN